MSNRINDSPIGPRPRSSTRELREAIVDRTPDADPELAPLAGELLPPLAELTGELGITSTPWTPAAFDSGIDLSRSLADAARTLCAMAESDPAFGEAAAVVERYRTLREDLALEGPLDL